MQARNTHIRLIYEGKDITRDISPFLLSFTFTDNASGNADDISFTLEDRKSIWLTDWMPSKGDRINATIITEGTTAQTLPCGDYDIDQIEYSMPPRVMSVKCVSASVKKSVKGEKHSRAWENVTLSAICGDIAATQGLALHYSGGDIQIERREQIQQSDLEFLESLCNSYALNVKITGDKLIIYRESEYDSHEVAGTITPTYAGLISCKFTSKCAGTYRRAKVKYWHPTKAEYYESECEDDDEEGCERELVIHERVDSPAQAEQSAKGHLEKANSKEITASLTLKGDTRFMTGINITLEGFGIFSGKYFIDKATHSITTSGYTTELSLKMGNASKKSLRKTKAKAKSKSRAITGGELFYEGNRHY